ncbi:hypothetical protein DPMN_053018 [Dreissena polymorpha]|uniref:Uncharacterized protein n=1 Tax=Dreissena polymorpha TaxID=45954 RepID=A0A9D4HQA2_DREPO|nr:hypothetical protein DPMN_053018 [Dreissena polymorpha]
MLYPDKNTTRSISYSPDNGSSQALTRRTQVRFLAQTMGVTMLTAIKLKLKNKRITKNPRIGFVLERL